MSQYIYTLKLIRPALLSEGPTETEAGILAQHAEYIEALTQEGQVLLAGRTQTADASAFGIVIFEASDAQAARALMENDPAVQLDVMRAELFPYRIAFLSDAISISANSTGSETG